MSGQVVSPSSAQCENCHARRHGPCASLPAASLARFAEAARPVDYPAGHCFWDEDGRVNFVGILKTGYLRMLRYTADGRRQIMALVGPGDIVGEGFRPVAGYRLEASTPATMCRFEPAVFERLLEREPELRRAVCRDYLDQLDGLRRTTWSLGVQSPRERLCAFLSLSCRTMPFAPSPKGGGLLTLELPRADIADLLGTTKETISRLTHRLQSSGLLRIRDPRRFFIPDLARLERAGGLNPPQTARVKAAQPQRCEA